MTFRAENKRGFTLVELLVVMAVMGILLALIVPSVTGLLRGNTLSQEADVLVGQLKRARQQAISENKAIDVRFYSYKSDDSGGAKTIRAVQLWKRRDDGVLTATTEIQRLTGPVVITENSKFTKIGADVSPGPDDQQLQLPASYTYRTFQFRPDGSTNLNLSDKWYFTMVLEPESEELPANFATIQIEPLTGAVTMFRP